MAENKVYTAIGLMSGTSLDGVDVALVMTNGQTHTKLLDFKSFPYEEALKTAVSKVFGRHHADGETVEAERLITQAHIQAVKDFGYKDVDIIGFHGQTITHDPANKFTWQIGDGQVLADATGIDVVADMRKADVLAGGQGAPLLPICHRAFATSLFKPVVILNLGGVGNLTWLGENEDDILAFDTGPGNALIDDFVKEKTGQDFDEGGMLAKLGNVDQDIIDRWLSHPYFAKAEPKSLDRNAWDVRGVHNSSVEDGAATLTAFTVQSVLKGISMTPRSPCAVYVAGGGRLNKQIMAGLQVKLPCPVAAVEEIGWNGDALEAQGFAYLAVRSLLGYPLTLPTTTGVSAPLTGGELFKARQVAA